jgi:hypothetical protein
VVLITVVNLREFEPNLQYYRGFHLLPYVAGMSVLASWLFGELFIYYWSKKKTKVLALGGSLLLCLQLLTHLTWVFDKKDRLSDYHIQYDTFQAYGTALKTIAHANDTLLTGPNGHGYMNILGGVPIAGKQNFHIEWAYRVPDLRATWLEMLDTSPPTFIYFDLGHDSYSQHLIPLVATEYVALQRADGSPTQLLMKKSAIKNVTSEQWQKFEDQAFLRPELE